MRKRRLSRQFLVYGFLLLGLALASIGSTMWMTKKVEGGAAAVNEAGRLRMQTWRLVNVDAALSPHGRSEAWLAEFERSLQYLEFGVPSRPLLVPWNLETRQQFHALKTRWLVLKDLLDNRSGTVTQVVSEVDEFVGQIDGFVLAIETVLTRYGAMLALLQLVMMALAVSGAVVSLYVAYLYVVSPVQRLRDGLTAIQSGNFSTRIESAFYNEFSDLADGFNHMAQHLGELYHDLERQVDAKTRDLKFERERLSVLYEVSSFLIDARSLEEIAQGFAKKVRAFSKAEAVAVRWSDETSRRYLMLGSDQLPEELVAEERCLEAGLCACGQLQETAKTRVIPIISETDQRLGRCAKLGYTSLVSVPIRAQDRVLGEVDLFFHQETHLTEADRHLYDTLSGQLATALEYLRSMALLRETAVSEERALLARELHDSIAQSLVFLKIQVSLLRQALNKNDIEKANAVVQEIDVGVQESTSDVRELLVHFRTRANIDDMGEALRVTLNKFELQSGLKSHLSMEGHAVELAPDTQIQVLHVIQEALSNVRKHAQATEVRLKVERGPVWRFSVRDNGQGFLPKPMGKDDTHVGLHIMRERAQRIGAKVSVNSAPDQGTEVSLELQGESV